MKFVNNGPLKEAGCIQWNAPDYVAERRAKNDYNTPFPAIVCPHSIHQDIDRSASPSET